MCWSGSDSTPLRQHFKHASPLRTLMISSLHVQCCVCRAMRHCLSQLCSNAGITFHLERPSCNDTSSVSFGSVSALVWGCVHLQRHLSRFRFVFCLIDVWLCITVCTGGQVTMLCVWLGSRGLDCALRSPRVIQCMCLVFIMCRAAVMSLPFFQLSVIIPSRVRDTESGADRGMSPVRMCSIGHAAWPAPVPQSFAFRPLLLHDLVVDCEPACHLR